MLTCVIYSSYVVYIFTNIIEVEKKSFDKSIWDVVTDSLFTMLVMMISALTMIYSDEGGILETYSYLTFIISLFVMAICLQRLIDKDYIDNDEGLEREENKNDDLENELKNLEEVRLKMKDRINTLTDIKEFENQLKEEFAENLDLLRFTIYEELNYKKSDACEFFKQFAYRGGSPKTQLKYLDYLEILGNKISDYGGVELSNQLVNNQLKNKAKNYFTHFYSKLVLILADLHKALYIISNKIDGKTKLARNLLEHSKGEFKTLTNTYLDIGFVHSVHLSFREDQANGGESFKTYIATNDVYLNHILNQTNKALDSLYADNFGEAVRFIQSAIYILSQFIIELIEELNSYDLEDFNKFGEHYTFYAIHKELTNVGMVKWQEEAIVETALKDYLDKAIENIKTN